MDEKEFIIQIGRRLNKVCIFVWSIDEYKNYVSGTVKAHNNIICLLNGNCEIVDISGIYGGMDD